MILAFHSIFGFYGFWLPNDPRGSGSDYVANWELFRGYGRATTVTTRHSVAHTTHNQADRVTAKQALKFPPVVITGIQALDIAREFARAIGEAGYRVHACAILPDHVHLVIGWHVREIRTIVGHLKSRATMAIRAAGHWGQGALWGDHGWNVFLDDVAHVERSIRYVEANPVKEGKQIQRWGFVTPFDLQTAVADRSASQATRLNAAPRTIGGAALKSHEDKYRPPDHNPPPSPNSPPNPPSNSI